MATKEQLEQALRNAHNAGDLDAARQIAKALKAGQQSAPPAGPSPSEEFAALPFWQKPVQAFADVARIASNAVTLGGRDRFAGYLSGRTPEEERALTAAAKERAGSAGLAAEVGGMMAPAMLTGGATTAIPAAAGPLTRGLMAAGIGGAEGAGLSGIQAVFEEGDVLDAMKRGAMFGAGGSVAADLLTAGLNKGYDAFTKQKRLTPDELFSAKNQAYDEVERIGAEYKPNTVRGALAATRNAADPYPGRHDQVIATRKQLAKNLGQTRRPVSLSEIDLNRQIINRDLAGLPDRAEQGMGLDMRGALDDYLDQVPPSGVTARSGNPDDALAALKRGRDLNRRAEKLEGLVGITGKVTKGERQARRNLTQGEDTTLRSQIDQIMGNPKLIKNYTPDEIAAMDEIVRGTKSQQRLRQIGTAAPGGGKSFAAASGGAALGGLLTGGSPVGFAVGGSVPPAIGYLSKKLSERSTKKSVENFLDLVASGGKKAVPKKLIKGKERDALAKTLMLLGISDD